MRTSYLSTSESFISATLLNVLGIDSEEAKFMVQLLDTLYHSEATQDAKLRTILDSLSHLTDAQYSNIIVNTLSLAISVKDRRIWLTEAHLQTLLYARGRGVDLNKSYTCSNSSLLITAIRNSASLGIINALIEAGASINFKAPLAHAIYSERTDIIQALICHPEINFKAKDNNGDTALIAAARAKKANNEVISILLESKDRAMINAFNKQGKTALDVVIDGAFSKAKNERRLTSEEIALANMPRLERVHLLLKNGAIVQHPSELFAFLKSCDPRNFDVLRCLNYLADQLANSAATGRENNADFSAESCVKIENYRKKLGEIILLPEIMGIVEATAIPDRGLSNIISDYCVAPCQFNFFQMKEHLRVPKPSRPDPPAPMVLAPPVAAPVAIVTEEKQVKGCRIL